MLQWSAAETADRVRNRHVTAREVTEAHLAHIENRNPSLNAITRHDADRALAEAAEVDRVIGRGDDVGPLAGVPVTIKDNVDVEGETTPNGLAHLDSVAATHDNPAVTALRAAGAVVVGRTNTPEFSWRWHTENRLFGATINPRNPRLTPGGSSGGASAALAAGMGCLALGNDAGGSLRWPAVCTGTASLRPTVGRVASHNATAPGERPFGVDLMAVQGPMARTVTDVGLMYEALVAPSWRDPNHVPVPARIGEPPRRVGFHMGGGAPLHPAVATALDRARAAVERAGLASAQPQVPDIADAAAAWATLINADFDTGARSAMEQHGGDAIELVLAEFTNRSGPPDLAGLYRAHATRAGHLREWQRVLTGDVDALVMPAAMEPAWPAGDDLAPGRMTEIFAANTPLVTVNLLGLPAAAVGVGLVDDVPVGVQIVGPRFGEAAVLDVAAVIEAEFPPSPPALVR